MLASESLAGIIQPLPVSSLRETQAGKTVLTRPAQTSVSPGFSLALSFSHSPLTFAPHGPSCHEPPSSPWYLLSANANWQRREAKPRCSNTQEPIQVTKCPDAEVGKQWEGPSYPWEMHRSLGGGQEGSGFTLKRRFLSVFQAQPHSISNSPAAASFLQDWPSLGMIVTHWVNATEGYEGCCSVVSTVPGEESRLCILYPGWGTAVVSAQCGKR